MSNDTAAVAFRLREEVGFPCGTRPQLSLNDECDSMDKILSKCVKSARKAGISARDIHIFKRVATSGNYDRFVEVISQYFEVNPQ